MTTGALQGLLYCGNILIPSLFPFMVLSAFVVKSGLADYIGKLLSPVAKKLFNVSGATGTVILLGLTGGFPVGAKGIVTLYNQDKISLKTARQLVMFLVGGGPGFVVTVVGKCLYNSVTTGLIIWLCQMVVQIILGVFACRNIEYSYKSSQKVKAMSISNNLVSSTDSGINSMMLMCGLVVIFSCIYGICEDIHIINFINTTLNKIGLPENISNSILSVLWEVTKGCNTCSDNACPVWLMAFCLGWGGVCVHFQIYSICNSLDIPKLKFTAYRFAQGVMSAVLTGVVFNFYKPAITTYSTVVATVADFTESSAIGSVALISMCIVFLISVSSNEKGSKIF